MFWLGAEFDGHELDTSEATGAGSRPFFVYGTCEGTEDAGCAPPYQLQQFNLCRTARGHNPFKLEPLDGAPPHAKMFVSQDNAGVEVVTGKTEIRVYGGVVAPDTVRAARALRPVTQLEKQGPLPPPVKGAAQGRPAC